MARCHSVIHVLHIMFGRSRQYQVLLLCICSSEVKVEAEAVTEIFLGCDGLLFQVLMEPCDKACVTGGLFRHGYGT